MAERKRIPRGLLDPESQAIEEAVEAAPRVPASLAALGRGFYEANIAPLLSPVQTARGLLAVGREFVRDPRGTASAVAQAEGERLRQASQRPESAFEYYGGLLSPFSMLRRAPTMAELDVYHGTPHRFPATEANPLGEFDASKIGTGEGAQAYGHGVYLAEAPEVAEVYRSATNPIARKAEMTLQMTNGNINKAIEFIKREKKTYERHGLSVQQTIDTLDYLKQTKKGKKPEVGAFYKADLPDEMIDRMLDWDASIKSQPENVRKAVEPFMNKYGVAKTADIGTLISAMEREMPSSMVSEKLREAGIPGIKYLDAGSRGQGGSGTRNFVVFPGEEKKVRILERK